jgi:FlaA1/EpsC-like NDP-sugar epimerase
MFDIGSPQNGIDVQVVGRPTSLFAPDVAAHRATIGEQLAGARILVVGGGGSIGSVTTQLLFQYVPTAIHVVDQSENYLAELVRNVRGSIDVDPRTDFRLLPIDFGGPICQRLIRDERPYDVVLNFAALKHVRSEKDVYSLLQMLDTNVVRQARFKEWIAERGGTQRYFGVSTDKAANPASLMGATKRLMEDVLFTVGTAAGTTVTSARFANVAFSNGSLPQAWLRRLELGQPLAVPRETRRYFVTQREAGEICVLAASLGKDGEILIPRLDPESELRVLESLAVKVLNLFNLEPVLFTDEAEARRSLEGLKASKRWPLLLTPRDTSGEKAYEEFVGDEETAHEIGLEQLCALRHASPRVDKKLIRTLEALIADSSLSTTKGDIVAALMAAIPNFHHVETEKTLDSRM